MTRFVMPTVLIGIAIAIFFIFTNPIYNQISALQAQVSSYDNALSNSKALENERDKLTSKYNSIDPSNIDKLSKLLPDNVDNIRLILEIEKLAAPYGMVLTNIKYNTTATGTTTSTSGTRAPGQIANPAQAVQTGYGTFDLEFSTSGTYDKFINFTKDLENNLRIVDISSISFSSDNAPINGAGLNSSSPDTYNYNFKIKTYWLKN